MNETLVIPDDLAACQAMMVEQARAIAEQSEKITGLNRTVQEQQLTINELLAAGLPPSQRTVSGRPESTEARLRQHAGGGRRGGGPGRGGRRGGTRRRRAQASQARARKAAERTVARAPAALRSRGPGARRREALCRARRAEADRPRPGGDAGVRAAQAQGPRHALSEVRLRERAGLRRGPAAARAGPGRRKPLRHERGGGDRHRQVRLSPADLSRAGLLRRLRLDGGPQHAVEHLPGVGRVGPSVGVVPAWRGARQRSDRHGRDAGDALVAAGDPGGERGRSEIAADPRGVQPQRGPKGARASRGGCGPTAA